MNAACSRESQAARLTYALGIIRTVCKSFVCKSVALNISAIIGRSLRGPSSLTIPGRKSPERAEGSFSLCNSPFRSFLDRPRSAPFGPARSAALFPAVRGAA
jgi:hypothetical protein